MKINKRKKSCIILVLIFTSFILSLTIVPLGSDRNYSEALNLDEKLKTSTANKTDEISTVFTWKSTSTILNNNSLDPLSLDSFVANLTDFDPINSTSYTNLQTINTTYQPSNASWNHFRDFDDNVLLPSVNKADMLKPYDTTVFFAREDAIYNIKTSWEAYVLSYGNLETYLFLFNQSQFHDFENYIKPWRAIINSTVTDFKSDHDIDDWLIEYSNSIGNGLVPQTMNASLDFTTTINKTGWYYLVMWGPGSIENPKVETQGNLLSDGAANANITANELMDIYRPSLGKVNVAIDMPEKVYERVVRGYDETYGDSLAIIYIFEYAERKLQTGISDKADNDWVPYIVYIKTDSVGQFPDRIVTFYDDSWADLQDRYIRIIDPSFSSGSGNYQYNISITGNLAPYLNETVIVNATVTTNPISMENRLGASLRLTTTTNSHGFEIKPYNDLTGTTFAWSAFPKYALDNITLRSLYNETFNEFISNGWMTWNFKNFPAKTPFTLYFNKLFTAPYICSGLDNILLISPEVSNWIDLIDPNNLYFNSSLEVQVNTTIDIPVNFDLTYPENEPLLGEFCNFNLSMGEMGNPNITIDYMIDFNMSYSMGLFTGAYNITQKNTMEFEIYLQELNLILDFFGVDDGISGLASRRIQEQIDTVMQGSKYVSIENFLLGDHVVGNLVSCDITIHTWPIIKKLIKDYKPDWYLGCIILDELVFENKTGLDLILTPQLQGVVNGTLVGEGLSFTTNGFFEFNETQKSILFQAERISDFSSTDIQLKSIVYFLNFHIDWAFEVNFNDIPHYFDIDDLHWELGTYPSIDFAQNPMDDSDNLTLSWTESATPPLSPTLSILTPSPTTNHTISLGWTSSTAADNYTLYRHTESITSVNLNSATEIKTITGTSTLDIAPGIRRWFYAITATNESGSSDPSNSPYIDIEGLQTISFVWNQTWGMTDPDYGRDVAIDSEGNIFVVGSTNNFGAGGVDIVLLKYSPLGVLEWNSTWGGSSSELGNGIAIDSSDNIYVVGYYSNTTTTRQDMALVKFNNDGAQIWNRTWGQTNAETDQAESITIDANDNIYITGYTNVPGSDKDVVLVKYSSSGVMEWDESWGGPEADEPNDVTVDSQGNIFVTGYTNSYNPGSLMFILKYNNLGQLLSNFTWYDFGTTTGEGIAIDSDDNIYVTGRDSTYLVLVKFDSDNNYIWNTTWYWTIDTASRGFGVAIDSAGFIYVTGYYWPNWDLRQQMTFLQYNNSGSLLWNMTWGGPIDDVGYGIATDSSINLYFVATTESYGPGDPKYNIELFKFLINDAIKPSVVVNSFDPQAEAGIGTINVQVNASDNYQIQAPVQIRFYEPDSTVIGTFNMTNSIGDTWIYSWDVSSYTLDNNYYFKIIASDETGNINDTVIEYFDIVDTVNPSVILTIHDTQAEAGLGTINVQANISDNYQIQNPVQIRFYEPDSTIIGTFSMTNPVGNTWTYAWNVDSYAPNSNYYFRINATDTESNTNDTVIEYFDIVDTTDPSVKIYSYDSQAETGVGLINVQINATDNYQIQSPVQIRFYEPDSTIIGTFSMTNPVGNTWTYAWDVDSYAPNSNYYFRIIAADTESNINDTIIEYFDIVDTTDPSVGIYYYDSQAETGVGLINVQINATDNYQIQSPVQIRFYYPNSTIIGTFDMNNPHGNLWNFTWNVGSYIPNSSYSFRILASDTSSNINDTVVGYFDIIEPPELIPPNSPILTITTPSPTINLVIALEWTTSVGADNYSLYRYTSPINSSNLNSTTFIKSTIETNTTDTVSGVGIWYYAVVATNMSGSSDPSNTPYIEVKEAPEPPIEPILTITTSSPTTSLIIALEWTSSVGADNYTLHRYTSPITSSNLHLTTQVKTITEITTTDTVPGIGRWYYAVVATNESGTSGPSNYDFIDVQEETTPEEPGGIPGYPLYFIGIICITTIFILYKKMIHLKMKS